jgi:hypothetical protein
MNDWNNEELLKSPEFKEWLIGLLSDQNPTTITFLKKDGSNRTMRCTRNTNNIPPEHHPKSSIEPTGCVRVFDLDKNEWRSFLIENIKRIEYSL